MFWLKVHVNGPRKRFNCVYGQNHVDPDNEYVLQLCVRDTGRGMSSQTLSKLAEPFKQADPTRDCGSGIGLAIAKQFVERMNGNFIVRSQLGIGTGECEIARYPSARHRSYSTDVLSCRNDLGGATASRWKANNRIRL